MKKDFYMNKSTFIALAFLVLYFATKPLVPTHPSYLEETDKFSSVASKDQDSALQEDYFHYCNEEDVTEEIPI